VGYSDLKKQRPDFDSSDKTLKEQVSELAFREIKKIKIFSLLVRFLISLLLFVVVGFGVYSGVYDINHSYGLVLVLLVYASAVAFLIQKTKALPINSSIHNYFDLLYVTLEIVAVYVAILIFPTHLANIYSNSLRGFWFVLIILSVFTGRWYYGFYSGFLVAMLNLTYLVYYEQASSMLKIHNLNLQEIMPSFQVIVLSLYYMMAGAFVSFPFYLFDKVQRSSFSMNIKSIVAVPYYDLSMKESDVQLDEYVISKIITSSDVVGADYVCLKSLEDDDKIANLIVGDTIGHGLNRSPGAIITMSAFLSCLSNDPLDIQKAINSVLINIDKETGGKTYCLSLLLRKNGVIEYAGRAENLILVKHGFSPQSLTQNGEILGVAVDLPYTQTHNVILEPGDMLIVQTDGAVFDNEDDDKTIVMISRNRHL